MARCTIIDTFPAFETYWQRAKSLPLDEQIAAWASDYMAAWPGLLGAQVSCYAQDGLDWRQVARAWVFPHLAERLSAMVTAYRNLPAVCAPVHAQFEEALGLALDVTCVIYVGIGCGAGWATTYEGQPAVLCGLENVAECGWTEPEALRGLVAHEFGHLAHQHWRVQAGLPPVSGSLWDLYEEGLAQRCEHVILGHNSWHEMTGAYGAEWLPWCREHCGWLAAEFLRRVEAGEDTRPFFGSWLDVQGVKQTGYFLGHELVCALEAEHSLQEIACFDEAQIEKQARSWLVEIACSG